MEVFTEHFCAAEQRIDDLLIKKGGFHKHVMYRGLRIIALPAAAVAIVMDVAFGALALLGAALKGFTNDEMNTLAAKKLASVAFILPIAFQQIVKFITIDPRVLMDPTDDSYSAVGQDKEISNDILKEKCFDPSSDWDDRNVRSRIASLVFSIKAIIFSFGEFVFGAAKGVWAMGTLGTWYHWSNDATGRLASPAHALEILFRSAMTMVRVPL